MKKFLNTNVTKESKRLTRNIIISIAVIIIGVLFYVWGLYKTEKAYENIQTLNDVIMENSNNKENKIAKVEITYIPYLFAVQEGNDNSYYIIMDDTYMYIAYMSSNTFNIVNKEDMINNPQELKGTTKSISREIKELAIQSYNESVEEEDQITMTDFELYFGDVYLDTTDEGENIASTQWEIGFLLVLFGLIALICTTIQRIKFNKSIKKLDEDVIEKLDSEMNSSDAFYYEKAHLYLTKDYVINFNGTFKAIEYSEIIWMYSYILRTNGIKTSQAIKIMTRNGKTYQIANISIVTKTKKEIYDEIWNTIVSKNNNIILGYTSEAKKQAKETIEK